MDVEQVEILYEQGPCLVVLKPAGLLTQSPPGIPSLEERIKSFLNERDALADNVYLPHRLDRPVSGAILVARDAKTCRRLSDQFSRRQVGKRYWACVEGIVAPAEGTWEDWLRKIPGVARAEVVAPDHAEGSTAVLHYRTLGQTQHGSWLEIELETGRTHQIRIQAASRGHPIAGDAWYGATSIFGPQYEDTRQRAIALHARSIEFRHPLTHETVNVTAPLPSSWAELKRIQGTEIVRNEGGGR